MSVTYVAAPAMMIAPTVSYTTVAPTTTSTTLAKVSYMAPTIVTADRVMKAAPTTPESASLTTSMADVPTTSEADVLPGVGVSSEDVLPGVGVSEPFSEPGKLLSETPDTSNDEAIARMLQENENQEFQAPAVRMVPVASSFVVAPTPSLPLYPAEDPLKLYTVKDAVVRDTKVTKKKLGCCY